MRGLAYIHSLESELSFVLPSSGFKINSGTVSHAIGSIPDGGEAMFSYTLKVTALDATYRDGELWLHMAGLKDNQDNLDLTRSYTKPFLIGDFSLRDQFIEARTSMNNIRESSKI